MVRESHPWVGAGLGTLDRRKRFRWAFKTRAGRGVDEVPLVGGPLISKRCDAHRVRGWHIGLVVTVIRRVMTVLVNRRFLVRDVMAMAMIVLSRVCIGMRVRVCGRMQGIVRRGDCARERQRGVREDE